MMPEKNFTLQPVLNYRQLREDQVKQELGRLLAEENSLYQSISAEEEDLHALYETLEVRQQEGMSVDELLLYQHRISHKVARLAELAEQMDRLRNRIDRQRAALLEASRDKKLLEKLKERKADEYRREMNRRETIVLDEIAVQFHRR